MNETRISLRISEVSDFCSLGLKVESVDTQFRSVTAMRITDSSYHRDQMAALNIKSKVSTIINSILEAEDEEDKVTHR